MSDPITPETLHRALAAAPPPLSRLAAARLVPLPGRGIAHDHVAAEGVRLDGRRVVLRIPRVSQWGLDPHRQLAYEAAAFARAAPSGVTPVLLGTLPPGDDLPMGALAVERVDGTKPALPRDLPALARCLARIHTLPLPPPEARPPLLVHDDPVIETLKAIREQASYLREAGLAPMAAAAISGELARAENIASAPRATAVLTLTGSDTHPGNFLIGPQAQATFVDLEKALYGNPAVDLAHATLYTSTMWDPDCAVRLAPADVEAFYKTYFAAVPLALAAALRPWIVPIRRLVWLRTLTWCIRWKVLSRRADGWSKSRLTADHAAHIERIVEDYTSLDRIALIREGLANDERIFAS